MMNLKIENLIINFPLTDDTSCIEMLFGKLISNENFIEMLEYYEIDLYQFFDIHYFDAKIEEFFNQEELNPLTFQRFKLKMTLIIL